MDFDNARSKASVSFLLDFSAIGFFKIGFNKNHGKNIPCKHFVGEASPVRNRVYLYKLVLMNVNELPEKLKLIWDFRGPAAAKIAAHHEIHLKQFIQREQTKFNITGVEKITEMHSLVFMVIGKEEMESIRKALKPQRAQVWD